MPPIFWFLLFNSLDRDSSVVLTTLGSNVLSLLSLLSPLAGHNASPFRQSVLSIVCRIHAPLLGANHEQPNAPLYTKVLVVCYTGTFLPSALFALNLNNNTNNTNNTVIIIITRGLQTLAKCLEIKND